MQIVIDIPNKIYESVQDGTYCGTLYEELKNGTPLPKGHGDLKDVSKIHLNKFVNCKNYLLHPLHSEDFKRGYNSAVDDVWNVLREAQTIIEADKEAEDEN